MRARTASIVAVSWLTASTACSKARPQPAEERATSTASATSAVAAADAGPGLPKPEWLTQLKAPESPATPFSCDAIKVHRAWHHRGEATVTPSPSAELVAVHFTTSIRSGFEGLFVGEGGKPFDTTIAYARTDAKGAPLDRFHGSKNYASYGPVDLVAIGAVPRGLSKITFRARGTAAEGVCDSPVVLEQGTPWPKLPRYEVTRLYQSKTASLMILYRATDVLPNESPAPTFKWREKGQGARVTVSGPRPKALANADASGEPAPYDPAATSRFVVAEYPAWPGYGIPSEYTAGDRDAPLPAPSEWAVSDALAAALDESMVVWQALGDAALSIYFSRGRAGLTQAMQDKSIYVQSFAYEPRRERR